MAADGTRDGYDHRAAAPVRALCHVPLVASGGAGGIEHFIDAFKSAQVDAALAASVFHSGAIAIPDPQAGTRSRAASRCDDESRR